MDKIRNIGIIAHIDAGKTTSTERILFYTGKNHSIGEVDEGSTTMDWMIQEQNRGITITSAAITCFWKDKQINIIDTPGHVDFTSEVERSLRVLDGALVIFCASSGVQPQSETVWRQSEKYKIPKIAYINKMDRLGADYQKVLNQIEEKFKIKTLPINIPIGSENNFEGIIDLLEEKEIYFEKESKGKNLIYKKIAPERKELFLKAKEKIIDTISLFDDQIAEKYLNEEKIELDLLKKTLRRECLNKNILISTCGSSLKNIGVQQVLDSVIDYLPSPSETGEIEAISLEKEKNIIKFQKKETEAPIGLIFKIQNNKETGPMCFFRAYSGKFSTGKTYLNVEKKKKERINKILRVSSDKYEQIETLKAGDIGTLIGLKFSTTGDTLASEHKKGLLENISFPEPVISISLEPETLSQRDKLKEALKALEKEDPTFKQKEENEEIIISGMGELHVEVLLSRIKEEWKLDVKSGKPQVNYKEGIQKEMEVEETFNKKIAGKDNFVKMKIKVEPSNIKNENIFINKVKNKLKENINDLLKEIGESCFNSGIKMGYPINSVIFTLVNIEYDEKLSTDVALSSCLVSGFNNACLQADPVLLEPVIKLDIYSPSQNIGDVMNTITSRNGIVEKIESKGDGSFDHLVAKNTLEKMFGYSTILRNASQGRAYYSMSFSHYEKKE